MVLTTPERSEENPIEKLAASVYPPLAMLAGMQLDLFTQLSDKPMNTEQIAETIGVGSAKLRPLLYALVVANLLNVEGKFFSNTDTANRFLVRGNSSCVVDIHEQLSDLWSAALKTAESIRTGVPQASHDYQSMSKDELQQFFRGQHPYAIEYGRDLIARYDFSSYRTLLDVGGGSGGLAIAVTDAIPNIQTTVVELSTVTPVTQHFIDEAGAGDRIKVIAADVVHDELPGLYDAAVMTAFLQVLSPNDARRALKNVSRVMNPGGKIYIRGGGIIDNSRTSPPELVSFNIVFVNVYDEGQAYTEQEHKEWLQEADFEGFRRMILPDGGSIITALKVK
ncbi:MAG: methyltransferase [Desulfobacterales bacterium]|jgi:ubiquinone/menaquinone biosynthesis C-methylase UbiE